MFECCSSADLPRSPTWSCDAATCLLKLAATAAAGQGSSQKRSLNLKQKQIEASVEGCPKASFEKVLDIPVLEWPTVGWGLKRRVMQQLESTALHSHLPSNTLSPSFHRVETFSTEICNLLNQNLVKGKKVTVESTALHSLPSNTLSPSLPPCSNLSFSTEI